MKKIILIFFLFIACNLNAQAIDSTWHFIAHDDKYGVDVYVHESTIKKVDSLIYIDVRHVYKKVQYNNNFEFKYNELLGKYALDCKNAKNLYLSASYYLNGKLIAEHDYAKLNLDWSTSEPGSTSEMINEYVCGRMIQK